MMTNSSRSFVAASIACLLLPMLAMSFAQADDNDPPTRVARLAYIQGSVSFQPAGTDDWAVPPINRPLTTGDLVWSDRNSRAELQLDGSSLRLAGGTSVSLLNLSDRITQIQLSAGTVLLRVRRLDDNETYEIDTPNLAFTVLRPGLYRVSVDDSGISTAIMVRRGQGEASGGGNAYPVYENESDTFSGTDDLNEVRGYLANQDEFDAWSATRDARWEHSESARFVSADVVGYEDLDEHGSWSPDPEYGNVWFPRGVESGWAPYHSGHWAYVAPWGYTWVDDNSWGFAPFHYGRWVSVRGAWGWIPAPPQRVGSVYVRPVYAPALVAWVGVGAGVAWFALGPREVYVPSYPVSQRYVRNINVSNTNVNTTVINNVYNTTIINKTVVNNIAYVNRNVPGAVATTTSQAFRSAQAVNRNPLHLDQRTVTTASVAAVAPASVPTRQAVIGSGRPADTRPPAAIQTRAIVARTAPPPAPASFEVREAALRNNGGRPLSNTQAQQVASSERSQARAAVTLAPPPRLIAPQTRPIAPPATERPAQPQPQVRIAPNAIHPNEIAPLQRPSSPAVANTVLERQHFQEQQQQQAAQTAQREQLQRQQDAEHQRVANEAANKLRQQALEQQQRTQDQQKVQAQQELEHQRSLREAAEKSRQQALEQQHLAQTQALAQRHEQEQQQLQAKQQEQRRLQESAPTPKVHKDGAQQKP